MAAWEAKVERARADSPLWPANWMRGSDHSRQSTSCVVQEQLRLLGVSSFEKFGFVKSSCPSTEKSNSAFSWPLGWETVLGQEVEVSANDAPSAWFFIVIVALDVPRRRHVEGLKGVTRRAPFVDEDWHTICQAISKGVEGAVWENLCDKFVEILVLDGEP